MRGSEYKKLALSMGCIVTGKPAVAHHVKSFANGYGRVSDFLIIPLCPDLHTDGDDSIHRDKSRFEMLYGREISLLAQTIQKVTGQLKDESIPF